MSNTSNNDRSPIIIHKEGEEGAITVSRTTGIITTPHNERPDWAEGFSTALLEERLKFYGDRLGKDSVAFKAMAAADAIETSDLTWIGVDADGDERTIDASSEYRMGLVTVCIGMDAESGELSGTVLAEHEVSRENSPRSSDEMAALEQSVRDGFAAGDTVSDQKKVNG